MRDILRPGMSETIEFDIPREKTVPFLYPEFREFQEIPEVFATGYMVGLMECCCIRSLACALEPGEGSLGTLINVTHVAPTPPGGRVTVTATVEEVAGRKIVWRIVARDDIDVIGEGKIGRAVVQWERFNQMVAKKKEKIDSLKS